MNKLIIVTGIALSLSAFGQNCVNTSSALISECRSAGSRCNETSPSEDADGLWSAPGYGNNWSGYTLDQVVQQTQVIVMTNICTRQQISATRVPVRTVLPGEIPFSKSDYDDPLQACKDYIKKHRVCR